MLQHEARRQYRHRFARSISEFHEIRELLNCSLNNSTHCANLPRELVEHVISCGFSEAHVNIISNLAVMQQPMNDPKSDRFRVFLRKRPCLQMSEEEYDCVSVLGDTQIAIHDGRLHRSGKTTFMAHHFYEFDRVFDELSRTEDVYVETTQPLVKAWLQGENASILLFGQTGTGKTYTTAGIQERLSREVFSAQVSKIELECFELVGDRCLDLLNERKQLTLLQCRDGHVIIKEITRLECESAGDLMKAIQAARSLRANRALERNHESSRSHAFCRLSYTSEEGITAVLNLVDLAGSERRVDTLKFSGTDHKESADINTALMSLKDCFRLSMDGAYRVPYRSHPLTILLRGCFEDPRHQTSVIATISPHSTDVEHTVHSTRSVVVMNPPLRTFESVEVECLQTAEEQLDDQRFKKWSGKRIQDWVMQFDEYSTGKLENFFGAGLDGKSLLKLSRARLQLMCEGDGELAELMFVRIREEAHRVNEMVDARRERRSRLVRGMLI